MEIRNAIEAFKKEIEKLYGKRLKKAILYGSYTRGDSVSRTYYAILGENHRGGEDCSA